MPIHKASRQLSHVDCVRLGGQRGHKAARKRLHETQHSNNAPNLPPQMRSTTHGCQRTALFLRCPSKCTKAIRTATRTVAAEGHHLRSGRCERVDAGWYRRRQMEAEARARRAMAAATDTAKTTALATALPRALRRALPPAGHPPVAGVIIHRGRRPRSRT